MKDTHDSLIVDFWNVGQGDASSILIESPDIDGKYVLDVIDVGLSCGQFISWLYDTGKHFPIVIRNLILTHNDSDHVSGLTSILENAKISITNVYLIEDRPWGKFRKDSPIGLLYTKYRDNFNRIELNTALRTRNIISIIGNYTVEVAFPSMARNIEERSKKRPKPNFTSAIIQLFWNDIKNGEKKQLITWCGDNKLATVCSHVQSSMPMLFGPHHGAPQDKTTSAVIDSIHKIAPANCFLSFSTNNPHGHPKPSYVRALLENGCNVICSQCARSCDKGRKVPIFNGDGAYCLKSPANCLTCHGHVRLEISDDVVFDPLSAPYLEAKKKAGKTLCSPFLHQ